MKSLSLIMLICLSACATPKTKPLNVSDCPEIVELYTACDDAHEKCQLVIKEKEKKIQAQEKLLGENEKRIKSLESGQTNKTLWFVLGSVVTGLLVFLIK